MPSKQKKDFQMGLVIIHPLEDSFHVQQSFRFYRSYLPIEFDRPRL